MDKQKNNLLTSNQVTFLVLGFVIGTGFFKLPNILVSIAEQDAWISAAIAFIYPIYIVSTSCYIIKKYPDDNILSLSKKTFGNLFGNILTFIFMVQFIIITIAIISEVVILARTYIVAFLTPLKIVIIVITFSAYAASRGLKVLGKINELTFYIFLLLMLFSIPALRESSVLNIQPVFGSGAMKILNGIKSTAYTYYGWESLLFFYPYAENTKAIKKSAFKAIGICAVVYIWTVIVTILFLGIDTTIQSYWPFILVFESIHVPIINNFRYVFMFVWILIQLRITANYYFAVVFNINNIFNISIDKICMYIYPFIVYLSIKFSDKILRDNIVDIALPIFIVFNIVFITFVALRILYDNKKK